MPIYEYEYVREDGEVERVELLMNMNEASDHILYVADGKTYEARRVMSLPAPRREDSDDGLPPIDAPFIP